MTALEARHIIGSIEPSSPEEREALKFAMTALVALTDSVPCDELIAFRNRTYESGTITTTAMKQLSTLIYRYRKKERKEINGLH